jgi:osmotically-inducible protein OsmY
MPTSKLSLLGESFAKGVSQSADRRSGAAGLVMTLLGLISATIPGIVLLQGCVPLVIGGAAATGVAVATDPRSAGTLLDDQSIEFKAADRLFSDAELAKRAHISAISYNRVILLVGQAPDAALRRRAEDLMRGIPDIRRVYNEIAVAVPTGIGTRSKDALITTELKAKLTGDESVHSSHIKVVTEDGKVYLLGLVTRAEADRATDIARRISGVKRVVKVFEYVEG